MMVGREITVFDFTTPGEAGSWHGINDVVMGGRSRGTAIEDQGGFLVFDGNVSLEGGGFASIRSPDRDFQLAGATELRLSCRGDGKTYKLSLRASGHFDGIVHQAAFAAPAGPWRSLALPLENFRPTYHGRLVPDAPPLDPASIRSFGLVIADRQEGAFRLEILRITAVVPLHRKQS